MKIILLQDEKKLGKKGQIIEASEGYARNYILPKKIGVEATPKNLNDLKLHNANEAKKAQELLDNAKALAEELKDRMTKEQGLVICKKPADRRIHYSQSGQAMMQEFAEQLKSVFEKNISVLRDKVGFDDKTQEIKASEKEVIAQEIVIQNDKLYLRCVDKNSKEGLSLNIKRIRQILARKDGQEGISAEPTVIKFLLKDFDITGLDNNEEILEVTDKGYIIEGRYHNEFIATQRILSFGANCIVVEPSDFKTKIIELIKKMREVYND